MTRLDDASPVYDECWVDVTLAHLTERRRAVYDASMLVWLYAAGA